MYYAEIVRAVDRLKRRYHETDPFKLCAAMGIILIPQSLGTAQDAIKGFYLESKRIRTITVNSDMPLLIQKIDEVKDFRPASTLAKGHSGDCYTVVIRGEEKFLFFEKTDDLFASRVGRWFDLGGAFDLVYLGCPVSTSSCA